MNIYIYLHAIRESFELIRTFSYRMGAYTPALYINIYSICILVCIAIVKEGMEAATHTRHTLDHHAGDPTTSQVGC